MQPFERLRAIARHGGDDREVVSEAAACLAQFDDDPAGLVVTCRQLLHHRPADAPLWWLCARVLAAPDPARAARDSVELLRDDRTVDRLVGVLPFPHDEPIAVMGEPQLTVDAAGLRPDLDMVLVDGTTGSGPRSRLAMRRGSVPELLALGATHVLIEASGGSATEVLVPMGTGRALDELADESTAVWMVASQGRLLPDRLYDALRAATGDLAEHGLETLDVHRAARVAGPHGLDRPDRVGRRIDAPIASELLRPL